MLTASVKVFERFPDINEAVDRLAENALNDAAEAAAAEAIAIGAARNATDIHVIPAHGGLDGFVSGIYGKWYYRFQSFGTLGRALHPKRPGTKRTHAPGTGITPNYMYQRARTAGRRALLRRLERGF